MTVYQSGEAVRITLTVKDEEEEVFAPTSVDSLSILTPSQEELAKYTSGFTNSSTGVYYKDYVLPSGYSYVVAEWAYTYSSTQEKKRTKIEIKFV